jgi:drug/metabolite transporter (DMT)-like permease
MAAPVHAPGAQALSVNRASRNRMTQSTKQSARQPAITNSSGDRLIGIALMCGALACFACLDATAKWLTRDLNPLQVTWARYASSALMVFILINPLTSPGVARTKRPWLQGFRSLLLLASTAMNFIALQYLQLAETISIMFMTPFLVALLSGPLLGEWVGPRRLIAICIGFLGVLVVLRPGLGGLHPVAFLSVIGACCYAVFNLTTRMLAASDSSETTMFYSSLGGVILLSPLLGLFWVSPPGWQSYALMAVMGFFATFGHWLLIRAHRLAPAAVLAPFIYSQIVWMVVLGWWLFDQWPDRWTFIGATIVIACGLYLLGRERVKGLPPRPISE